MAGRPRFGGRADRVGRFSLGRPVKLCLVGRHNRCVWRRRPASEDGHGLTADSCGLTGDSWASSKIQLMISINIQSKLDLTSNPILVDSSHHPILSNPTTHT